MRVSIGILVLDEVASYKMRWEDEIILPLVLSDSASEVLSVDDDTLEAGMGSNSVHKILPYSLWESGIELKILQSLSFGGGNDILNTGCALAGENVKLVQLSCG